MAWQAYENSDAAKAKRQAHLAAARAVIDAYPAEGTYEDMQEAMGVIRREEARLAAEEEQARLAAEKQQAREEELARFATSPEGMALAKQRQEAEQRNADIAKAQAAKAAQAAERVRLSKLASAQQVLSRPQGDVPPREWKFALATVEHFTRAEDPGQRTHAGPDEGTASPAAPASG